MSAILRKLMIMLKRMDEALTIIEPNSIQARKLMKQKEELKYRIDQTQRKQSSGQPGIAGLTDKYAEILPVRHQELGQMMTRRREIQGRGQPDVRPREINQAVPRTVNQQDPQQKILANKQEWLDGGVTQKQIDNFQYDDFGNLIAY